MYFLYWILNCISKHTCHVSLLYVLIKSLETTGIGNDEVYVCVCVCVCVCVPATVWTAQDYLFLWKITTPLIKCLLVKGTWYQLCPVRFFSEVTKKIKIDLYHSRLQDVQLFFYSTHLFRSLQNRFWNIYNSLHFLKTVVTQFTKKHDALISYGIKVITNYWPNKVSVLPSEDFSYYNIFYKYCKKYFF